MDAGDKDDFEELARAADALFLTMRQARSAALGADQLSLSQQALLEPLIEERALPVGALAAAAGVSVPTATRMLKQLEAKGTVTRTRSAQDERRVLIALTPQGNRQISAVRAQRRELQSRGYAEFTPTERRDLARQLRRLAAIVRSQMPPPPDAV
ncbi:MarR family winged helix-turn-helix transcriptional regulator [Nocardia terpenica]|uniref:HTH marR-type domain-containing protein n=1 Tax=Nocardia terpenica TaxID=455432 RepID=A0A164PIJ1_9NOCA|nr:MarR family winged helix-turn-helix transcriptional regulator [Nocardia terpenica]KZM75617.1 hypothetical protein AWN90_19845 [Nocardia terpenica]